MAKLVATFSNGFTDVYNGKRPVTAAWLVITPDGKFHSGHSIDAATAEKTARSSAAMRVTRGPSNSELKHCGASIYWDREAKKMGFKNARELQADCHRQNAEHAAKCKVEIVTL